MIKKILIISSLLWITSSLFAQNREFALSVQLKNSDKNGYKAYLQTLNYDDLSNAKVIDSTIVVNGKFSFKGVAPARPEMHIIEISNNSPEEEDFLGFFVAEPGKITMIIDSAVTIKGGAENTKHEALQSQLFGQYSEFMRLQASAEKLAAEDKLTEEVLSSMSSTAESITSVMSQSVFVYAKENIKNGVGEFYFINYSSRFSTSQLMELYELANADFREKTVAQAMMQNLVWNQENTIEGNIFKGVELLTLDGKSENFDKHIGKGEVVLIDFWASWCGPCRKEMPTLVYLYEKYRDQGFEIIGVSLDDNEAGWKSGIDAMAMTWPQYSDLMGWESVAARTYGIQHIPQSFLLDGEGIIVARDLRGNELISEVEKLLKKN